MWFAEWFVSWSSVTKADAWLWTSNTTLMVQVATVYWLDRIPSGRMQIICLGLKWLWRWIWKFVASAALRLARGPRLPRSVLAFWMLVSTRNVGSLCWNWVYPNVWNGQAAVLAGKENVNTCFHTHPDGNRLLKKGTKHPLFKWWVLTQWQS